MERGSIRVLELDAQGSHERISKVYTENYMACHTWVTFCPVSTISYKEKRSPWDLGKIYKQWAQTNNDTMAI